MRGVTRQHVAQLASRGVDVALVERGPGLFHECLVGAPDVDRRQRRAGARAFRMQRQNIAVARLGFRLAACRERRVAFGEQADQMGVARLQVGRAVLHIGGRFPHRLLELAQARLGLPLRQQALALAIRTVAGAAGERQHQQDNQWSLVHGVIPRVDGMSSGR